MGEETIDGEGIQATGHDRFQEEGLTLASNRAGGEAGRKLREPVQGCGQVMGAGLQDRAGLKPARPPGASN